MNSIKERISWCINQIKPQAKWSEILDSGTTTVSDWKKLDSNRMPPLDKAYIIANTVGKSLDWLVSGKDDAGEWVDVPVWSGRVAGGSGSITDSYMITKHKYSRFFAKGKRLHKVRVAGNSMDNGISIKDKDWLCVDETQKRLKDGGVFVLLTGDGFIVKQVFFDIDGGIRLVSANPDFPETKIKRAELKNIEVFGEVIEHSHQYV